MELKRGEGEQTWKYEKISEPIDKYFYSSVIIMIMLKMAIDVMCKNKSMENRESKKMHDEERERWGGWNEPKKWENNSLYQSNCELNG